MIPNTDRARTVLARRRRAGIVGVAIMLSSLGLAGCGIVKAVNKVRHDVENNKSTMDAFTTKMKSGEATTFEATYVTTGASPATIVYAVEPPKGLLFKDTPSAITNNGSVGSLDIVVNPSGEYSCTHPSSTGSAASSAWTCEKLPKTSSADFNNILDFYTPTHWVTFLNDFALGAGFAGDKVSQSTKTVNGFSMSCVDFNAPGVAGTSTICTTAQDILGYVKVAGDATSFEITKYTSSPSSSLIQLPPGATITTIPVNTSTTSTTS